MIERTAGELKAALQARRDIVEGPGRRPLSLVARRVVARALHIAARLSGRPIWVRSRTFWHESIRLAFPEVVSECIFRARYYEVGLTTMLLEHLRPGGVFLDVGAHFGYFSLLASAVVGRTGAVHAFEPTPSTYDVLSQNVRDCANITAVNQAMYNVATTLDLNDYGVEFSAYNSLFRPRLREEQRQRVAGRVCPVVATTIDKYLGERNLTPQFIKIDVENLELEVLKGAEETLRRRTAAITIEVGDDEDAGGLRRSRQVIDYLEQRGYQPMEYSDGALVPHQPRDQYTYDNLLFLARP
jgi:FkbM family methyltransferase